MSPFALALSGVMPASCTIIKTQLFQELLFSAASHCHNLVTFDTSTVGCVTVDTPPLRWRDFVCLEGVFAIAQSVGIWGLLRFRVAILDWIDFFSSFHQLRQNSQSCHSSGPLTRSAFVPFSLSSTPLTFPDTSISQVSPAIARCTRASRKIREFSPVRSL